MFSSVFVFAMGDVQKGRTERGLILTERFRNGVGAYANRKRSVLLFGYRERMWFA